MPHHATLRILHTCTTPHVHQMHCNHIHLANYQCQADTELADAAGLTPIFIAAQKGSMPLIKLLTETASTSIAGTDQHGLNLLGHAAELGKCTYIYIYDVTSKHSHHARAVRLF